MSPGVPATLGLFGGRDVAFPQIKPNKINLSLFGRERCPDKHVGFPFAAVCVRIYRKGTCADCAQGGVCTGHCSNKKTCAALKGVDKIAEDLGRGIK